MYWINLLVLAPSDKATYYHGYKNNGELSVLYLHEVQYLTALQQCIGMRVERLRNRKQARCFVFAKTVV